MNRVWVPVVLVLAVLRGLPVAAQDKPPVALKGAAEVIREVTAKVEASRQKTDENKNSVEAFRTVVNAYKENMDALSPTLAAGGWLELSEQFLELRLAKKGYGEWHPDFLSPGEQSDDPFSLLIGALPPPSAWPHIREGLSQRQAEKELPRRALLQFLMMCLARDIKSAQQYLTDWEAKGYFKGASVYEVTRLKDYLDDTGADNRALREIKEKAARLAGTAPFRHSGYENLPDVAGLLPQEEAEAFLRNWFTKQVPINYIDGDAQKTLALAQRIALEIGDGLAIPYWALVTGSPEGEKLYHLFMKRFPPFKEKPDAEADDTSPLGLDIYEHEIFMRKVYDASVSLAVFKVGNGQITEAIEIVLPLLPFIVKNFTEQEHYIEMFYEWNRYGGRGITIPAKLKYDFYTQLFAKDPDFPVGDEVIKAAIACGQASALEQHLTGRLKDPKLAPTHRHTLQKAHAALLLATDRVSEALAIRNSMLGLLNSPLSYWIPYAVETAEIAAWVGDVPAQNASIDATLALLKNASAEDILGSSALGNLVKALEKIGRVNEVEPLLIERLVWELDRYHNFDTHKALLALYVRHHRMADVIMLLENAPWWREARDVLEIMDREFFREGLSASIAYAFYETGRIDEARKLLTEIMLRSKHSVDWTYELLLKMAGDDLGRFTALMDTLYARDAFEERPLIWKAEALRRLKRLEEAEQVIRNALKVDPTDGEQPPGDRVRAYGVLADILADRGKAEDSQFFRDVVTAVRVAEDGDELQKLGLYQRSLEYYSKAETLFADAYCVQWRLAERLREMGRLEEAQKHYAIAFERMPEQFGQVASLCFGCMGVFDNAESVCAAELVLTRLVETPPVRPAAYYLLGQLREKQERYDEAYDAYQKALEMDPGYLDVMKDLYALKNNVKRPDSDWATLQTRMLRLDPLGLHTGFDGNYILDWASFWLIRNDAAKALPKPLETLFPLTANIERLETTPQGRKMQEEYGRYYRRETAPLTAADVLMQSGFARGLSMLNKDWASREAARAGKGQEDADNDEEDDEDADDEM